MSWRFAQLALVALLGFDFARDRGRSERRRRASRAREAVRTGTSRSLAARPFSPAAEQRTAIAPSCSRTCGFAYEGKGDHDEAIADYDEAIRLEPNNASAYAARGRVFENKGDPRRALADFNKALTLRSDLSSAIAGRDRMRAALAAVPGLETPVVAPRTPVVARAACLAGALRLSRQWRFGPGALVRRGHDPPRSEKCLGLGKAGHDLRKERRSPTGLGGFQQGVDAAGRSFQRDSRAGSHARRSGGGSRLRDARLPRRPLSPPRRQPRRRPPSFSAMAIWTVRSRPLRRRSASIRKMPRPTKGEA